MLAQLVYDGSGDPKLHATSGTPAEGQFMGTPAEKLVEICGRECYDSFGRGRSSVEYHAHINEVNHGSVQEHFQVTVQFIPERWGGFKLIARAVANRPGVWLDDATWPNGWLYRETASGHAASISRSPGRWRARQRQPVAARSRGILCPTWLATGT